mgnify:CR=1 FL=1
MNNSDKIDKSIKESRYIFLALFIALLVYFYSFGEFNLFMSLVVGCVFLIILLSNNFISNENKGGVAILHMVLIVLMIGTYDYFSIANDRLNNFANFFLPVAFLTTVYGFYLNMKKIR